MRKRQTAQEKAVRLAGRRPWLAALLSVLLPGLGHLYLGRPGMAVLLYGAALLGSLLYTFLALFGTTLAPWNVLAGAGFPLAVMVLAVILAIRDARRTTEAYELRAYNRWYVYAGGWILATVVVQPVIPGSLAEPIQLSSTGMSPTLLYGDRVLVNNVAYGVHWPAACRFRPEVPPVSCDAASTVIEFGKPQRGDIVVFRAPADPQRIFLDRVIGVPGDVIEIRNKVVSVNGQPLDEQAYALRIDPYVLERNLDPRDNYGPVRVPEQTYFVLGDNRDESYDSRYFGFVQEASITGKVTAIYWSSANLSVRWSRIGRTP